ncbi:MAG TPA: ABC transporter substrate-binding protein [Burkholderiales bacterium]|nr:ABC transporter substrate-binding protein [Burkholderiales bacterium]
MKRTLRITSRTTSLGAALLCAWFGVAQAQQMGAPASAGAPPAGVNAPAQPQAQSGAEATVRQAVEGVTAAINADKSIQAGNRTRINALVDNKIVPFVDPERMTERAVGPNWAKASAEQRQTLIHEFKQLLTNTYAGAFTSYQPDTKIDYKPTRESGDTAVVRSMVLASGRDPIPIDYYLEKESGGWKLVDLSVYNARLVELYKGQFNAAIAQGGVDGLIRDLKTKNGSAAPAKS